MTGEYKRGDNDLYDVTWGPRVAGNTITDPPLPLVAGLRTIPHPWPADMFMTVPTLADGRCRTSNSQTCRCVESPMSCKFNLNQNQSPVNITLNK